MFKQKEIPVYLFTGFLESGKTSGIQGTLQDERFYEGNEKTLLLVCEEGEKEFDLKKIPSAYMSIEFLENKEDLTSKYLTGLEKKYKTDRVVIEYNGMWNIDDLYNNLPNNWFVYQEMMFADCTTFLVYNQNMRSLMYDKIKGCQMIVFNRPENADKEEFHKIVRGISRNCISAYEYADEHLEYDEIEDPLPFDINAEVIEIADRDYALWYRDFAEDMSKYSGKKIKFKGITGLNKKFPENTILIGRHVMTCCVDDIEFKGLLCVLPEDHDEIKNRDWATVTGCINIQYHPLYTQEGPILFAEEIEKSLPPEEEIATF